MATTIAILSDIHFAPSTPIPERMGQWGSVLLTRAVRRLGRFIKPDLVLLLGDCIDNRSAPDAADHLRELKQIMDLLPCPWLAIPGNHDPAPDRFYEVFPKPADRVDVAGVRVLAFTDPEAPGYNATRTPADLQRMRAARSDGFAGPVVAMQHVSLYPAYLQRRLCYSYTNLDEVLRAAATGGIDLCVGGHSHTNTGIVQHGRTAFLSVDALCEKPFGYTLVTIDSDQSDRGRPTIRSTNEMLSMPAEYDLIDYHSHTQFAYCSENMHTTRSPQLAELMGLRAIALTEHSGQLYFPNDTYWNGSFAEGGAAQARAEDSRMAQYFQATDDLRSDRTLVGLEVDADFQGRLVLHAEDEARLQVKVGAVHVLREGQKSVIDPVAFAAEFKAVTKPLCHAGIDILAHPFRIFQRKRLTPPTELFPWLARLLKQTGVAAEINYHTNEPEPAFFEQCLEMGVPLTFASDAHNLYEVGEFYPHLRLLERIGVRGDLTPLMWRHTSRTQQT